MSLTMPQSFYEEAYLIHKIVFGAGFFFFLLLVVIVVRNRAHRLPLPPGPKGYPLIGNALSLPSERPWLTYCQWSKRFGDVIHLSALGQSIIILNSARSIYDLLERRSALYSDRPSTVMAGELVGYGDSPAFISNGPRHRTFRRLFSEVLIPRRVEEWRPLQEQKIQILVRGLTETPTAFRAHIRKYIASLVFEISHGHIVEGDDDYFIRMAKQVDDDISVLMVPGNFLVDFFSFLRYIPDWTGVPFKKKAKIFKQTLQNALNRPYQQVKEQIAAGNALPSFTASLIERKENPTEEDTAIFKWASFVFYTAGADTSVSVLSSFMLAMAVNPTKQRKAQAEIDRVIGSGRRPAFKDRLDLPYVESILKEVYRLNPVTPIAIPHNLNPTSDDEYRGWRIPKKSVVIANSWAVLHDAELYPFPFEFLPERYHQQEYQVNQSLSGPAYDGNKMNPDPRKFAFGYGRRVCPGQLLADDTVFISIVTILALFDIGPLTSGEEPKYTPHLISHPEEFTCDIRPRSKVAQDLQV